MTISILYEDPENPGSYYDLTNNLIDFGKLQLDEQKRIKVWLVNNDANRNLKNVEVNTVAHPTEQTGTAEGTYEACLLSLSESGPYSRPLNVGTIGPAAQVDLFLQWTIQPEAIPGVGIFAIYATGGYDI